MISDLYGPASLVLNAHDEVVYASGGAENILNMKAGAISLSILDMLEKPVRAELRALVHKCRREGREVFGSPQILTLKGEKDLFRFVVRLFDAERTEWILVSLEKAPVNLPSESERVIQKEANQQHPREWLVSELEQELTATRERLATVVEELEITNEALQTTNEELQSANEEYQSTNEELQTTNEEFQSANEELQTVNDELRSKSDEAEHVNYALQNILQSVKDPIIVVDRELRITRFSKDIEPYIPYQMIRANDLVTALPWRTEVDNLREKLLRVQSTISIHREVIQFGSKPVQLKISPYLDQHDEINGALLLFTDISELYVAQAALEKEKELAQVTLSAIGDGVIRTDIEGRIRYINQAASQVLGWQTDEAIGQKTRTVFRLVEDNGQVAEDVAIKSIQDSAPINQPEPMPLTTHGRGQIYVEYSVIPLLGYNNETSGCVITFRDVTERRRTLEQMEWHSSHDTLTGFLNRRAMDQALTNTLQSVRKDSELASYIFFDLDQFKLINDNWGHEAGDQLLKRLAQLIGSKLRPNDIIGRLGGDEFAVILYDCNLAEASNLAEILREALKNISFKYADTEISVSSSFGVLEITADYENITQIRVDADAACYTAKLRGRDVIQVYDPHDDALLEHRQRIRTAGTLNKDLREDNFTLFAQPIVPQNKKDKTVSAEILLRVHNDDGSLGSPIKHIEAANQYGYMLAVDRWVITQTLTALGNTPSKKRPQLAVNLSAASLTNIDFMRWFLTQLEASKTLCKHLCLELSEQVPLAGLNKTRDIIDAIVALGCKIALDDFGAGLSSLKHLTELDLNYVKLDKSLIQEMPHNSNYREIAQSVVSLAKKLNIQTVAEAVENEDQLSACNELEIDFVQGFLTGKPLPLADFLG